MTQAFHFMTQMTEMNVDIQQRRWRRSPPLTPASVPQRLHLKHNTLMNTWAEKAGDQKGLSDTRVLVPEALFSLAVSVLPILDSGSSVALRVCFLFFCPSR